MRQNKKFLLLFEFLEVRSWTALASPAACLASFGLLVLASGAAFAADSPAGSSQTVYLEYQELGSRIKGWSLDITPQSAPFKKEPALGGRTVCRGVINSAFRGFQKPGADFDHSINIPFLWDYTQGKLHLDLNRNGDLTDAPAYSTTPSPGNYYYQTFSNIHLSFNAEAPSHRVLVDIALYGYHGQNNPGGNLTWYSFWQGKVSLPGREWHVGLIENPNHLGSTVQAYLLLRPWNDREKPFSLEDGLETGFEFGTHLFLNGQAYRLTCDYLPGNTPQYKLELSEVQPELAEVALTGKYIERVVLNQHQSKVPFTVVLDRPDSKVRIPVGTYNKYWVVLKEKDTEAFCRGWIRVNPLTGDLFNVNPFTNNAGKTDVLNMGGPLTNSVTVVKRGRTLSLDYQLLGAGGGYRLAGPVDRTKPPQFTIYQGGKTIASGYFAYG
jgi:hypothetical protein